VFLFRTTVPYRMNIQRQNIHILCFLLYGILPFKFHDTENVIPQCNIRLIPLAVLVIKLVLSLLSLAE